MQPNLGNINDPYKPIKVDIKLLGLDLIQTTLTSHNEKISIYLINGSPNLVLKEFLSFSVI